MEDTLPVHVSDLEKLLIQKFVTSSSFEQMVSGNLNGRRRTLNLVIMMLGPLLVAKYATQLILMWIKPEDYWLKLFSESFLQVLGPVGTICNFCVLFGTVFVFMLAELTRVNESGKLDLITDLRSFLPLTPLPDRRLKPLTGQSLASFTRLLKYIVAGLRMINFCISTPYCGFHILFMSMTLTQCDSWPQIVHHLMTCLLIIAVFQTRMTSFFALPCALIISSQYVFHRLHTLELEMRKYVSSNTGKDNRMIPEFIAEFNDIAAVVVRHNRIVRHILSFTMSLMMPLFAVQFACMSMDYGLPLRILICSLILIIILPTMYLLSEAGLVTSRCRSPLSGFHSIQVRKRLSLKMKFNLLTTIKHATQQAEPIGFTIGNLKLFTRLTLIDLVLTSIGYTFMILSA